LVERFWVNASHEEGAWLEAVDETSVALTRDAVIRDIRFRVG
jgi:hypothetical protein